MRQRDRETQTEGGREGERVSERQKMRHRETQIKEGKEGGEREGEID